MDQLNFPDFRYQNTFSKENEILISISGMCGTVHFTQGFAIEMSDVTIKNLVVLCVNVFF